ncbi:MAG: TraR/DksA family transcriptional regulator [Flavobacteriales bacterium]|nr:TraR/DksA family transcriptional regulator [Flavobacteriales bacterium]
MEENKRYNKTDLQEFKEVITRKLTAAQNDLDELRSSLTNNSGNGTDDTSFASHNMEEGNSSLQREELMMLAVRQEKFIEQLMNALARIRNGSYGVCRITGELIPKARLLSVPHATTRVEAKQQEAR